MELSNRYLKEKETISLPCCEHHLIPSSNIISISYQIEPYIYSLCFALLGFFITNLYAVFAYFIPLKYNYNYTKVGILEPVSGLSNLCYLFCSYGLIMIEAFHKNSTNQQISILATVLCFLGSSSLAFHLDGSQRKTFQNLLDVLGIILLLGAMFLVSIHGIYHAYQHTNCNYNCKIKLITTIIAFVSFTLAIVFIKFYPQFELPNEVPYTFFLFTGAFIILLNTLSNYFITNSKWKAFEYCIFMIFHLGIAIYIQRSGEMQAIYYKDISWLRIHSDHYYEHYRNLYDVQHGCWHFITSFSLMEIILTTTQYQSCFFLSTNTTLTTTTTTNPHYDTLLRLRRYMLVIMVPWILIMLLFTIFNMNANVWIIMNVIISPIALFIALKYHSIVLKENISRTNASNTTEIELSIGQHSNLSDRTSNSMSSFESSNFIENME